MTANRLWLALTSLALLIVPSCGSGGGGSGGGSAGEMVLLEASNGFGQLLPHRAQRLDEFGQPTSETIALTTLDQITTHVTALNPVIAPTPWPDQATLPNGLPGNHYLMARFKQIVDTETVFDRGGGSITGLAGGVVALVATPDGATTGLQGRMFVGGLTVGSTIGEDGLLELQPWVGLAAGAPTALIDEGIGFPGTESLLPGSEALIDPRTLVFVADTDNDLSTYESFPAGAEIQLFLTKALLATSGKPLKQSALASATVGPDTTRPEVQSSGGVPAIVPGNGDTDVDPATTVSVRFTEPVQPWSLGDLITGAPASLSAAIHLQFGPSTKLTKVPFHVRPQSVYDLSQYELIPAFAFPGEGPLGASCGTFSQVDVLVNAGIFSDLAGNPNQSAPTTFFHTGQGAGLVNAPIAPEAIYIGRGGSKPSVSVLDTNGYGQGSGTPAYDPSCPWLEDHSNFRSDPNVLFQADKLIPPVPAGDCTFNGGSSGPFTLTRDSNLDSRLTGDSVVSSISDMALGHSLDSIFNNASPHGCQSGSGNACASTGFKKAVFQVGSGVAITLEGFENLMQFAPHPNPPPLVWPPTCITPYIGGQEPTSVDTLAINGASNLLTTGFQPFGNPLLCTPPDGLYSPTTHVFINWGGPSQQNPPPSLCPIFTVRQQIGHFLYIADRNAGEVVVLNSNRMTVIDRIPVPDPTSFAMGPNIDLLAVTNEGANSVSLINIDPGSTLFHTVTKTVPVGQSPTGIAWEPGNEDILVCNSGDSSVSIISVATLSVRKTLTNQLSGPLDVAVTPRQLGFGLQRYVYFAYILNSDGSVSVFESGPDGPGGWGIDEVIQVLDFDFHSPKTIQPDPRNLNSAFWVVHQNQLGADGQPTGLGGGAITNVGITGGQIGVIPLDLPFGDPSIREMEWSVLASVGSDQLTGVPTDVAFDDWTNFSTFPNFVTSYSSGAPRTYNSKGQLTQVPGGGITPANIPVTMYAAVPVSSEGPGVVDVFQLGSGLTRIDVNPFHPGVQSVPAPGANKLMHYWRQ